MKKKMLKEKSEIKKLNSIIDNKIDFIPSYINR